MAVTQFYKCTTSKLVGELFGKHSQGVSIASSYMK